MLQWLGRCVAGSIGSCGNLRQGFWLGFVLIHQFIVQQAKRTGLHHLAQHGFGDELAFAVIVDVDVQTVHDVEMRVGEELAHGGIAYFRGHIARGKTAEIGRG